MRPIDADALIEKCGGWYVEEGTESGFIGTLKNLLATEPTIQHEPQWIPVERELPEENERVLIYCVKCGIYIAKIGRDMFDKPVFWVQGNKIVDTAIAWMPLPEAYKPNK